MPKLYIKETSINIFFASVVFEMKPIIKTTRKIDEAMIFKSVKEAREVLEKCQEFSANYERYGIYYKPLKSNSGWQRKR